MPYIITRTRPEQNNYPPVYVISRRAVATLEEAREAAWNLIVGGNDAMPARTQIQDLPADGGTVGPLPDGTVIEVAPVEWTTLDPGNPGRSASAAAGWASAGQEIIDAYNKEQQ